MPHAIRPLWENTMSSTKPEVHDVCHCCEMRTETWPQTGHTKNYVKFGGVVFWDAWVDRQTDRQTYRHAHCNSLHLHRPAKSNKLDNITSWYRPTIPKAHYSEGPLFRRLWLELDLEWVGLCLGFVGLGPQICIKYLDSLLANQIPAKGVVTIVCRIEIRKMAEC